MKIRNWYFLCILIFAAGILLSGCTPHNRPEWADDFIWCQVKSVDDSIGGGDAYVCTSGDTVYYYDKKRIYSCVSGKTQEITSVSEEEGLKGLACSGSYLYYYVFYGEDNQNKNILYRVDLATGDRENIGEKFGIKYATDLIAHNNDIFILICDQQDKMQLLMINENGEAETLFLHDKITDTPLGEYNIYGDFNGDICEQLLIYATDGWQHAYSQTGKVTMQLNSDRVAVDGCKVSFNEKDTDLSSQVEQERGGASTNTSQCSLVEDDVYVLYEYNDQRGYPFYTDIYKKEDAIYRLNPYTMEAELVYQVDAMPTQIAGFSIERNCVYLLKLDGCVYRVDLDDKQEELVWIPQKEYSDLIFEDCNGQMYVFASGGIELLAILE